MKNLARRHVIVADCCLTSDAPDAMVDREPQPPFRCPSRRELLPEEVDVIEVRATPRLKDAISLEGHDGRGTLLGEALLNAMSWGADLVRRDGERHWEITRTSLKRAIELEFEVELNRLAEELKKEGMSTEDLKDRRPDFPERSSVPHNRIRSLAKLRNLNETRCVLRMRPVPSKLRVEGLDAGGQPEEQNRYDDLPQSHARVYRVQHDRHQKLRVTAMFASNPPANRTDEFPITPAFLDESLEYH